jgi:predicted RNA-binding Zn ribbon-like protein
MTFLRSGRPSVDLAWTIRFRNVWPTEMLVDSGALRDWLKETYPDVTFADSLYVGELLDQVRALRESVYALLMATAHGESWQDEDRLVINRAAQGARFVHSLASTRAALTRASSGEQVLSELATDAIDVFKSDRARIKKCEGPLCALPFLDESRGATRRWCATQRCGNRVNTKAYRERSRR